MDCGSSQRAGSGTSRVTGARTASRESADIDCCWGNDRGRSGCSLRCCADTHGGGAGMSIPRRVLRKAAALVALGASASAAVGLDVHTPACELKTL